MALVPVEIPRISDPIPSEVETYLAEARSRISEYSDDNQAPAFVACDFEPVYEAIRSVRQTNLAAGNVFCEWGSGFGVVASLASGLGFESYGIEIEAPLVEQARRLAEDTDHRVEFVQGSFVTDGAEHIVEKTVSSDVFWLNTEVDDAYNELQMDPDDFDVIFAYPWPGEDDVITGLFEHSAAHGALLVTYSYLDGVSLHRKV